MNRKQENALALRKTDVSGAIKRLNGDEKQYMSCLRSFLEDSSIIQLNKSVADCSWDEACTAAHALKGLAGNMGFIPLMHSTGHLIILIRGGRTRETGEFLAQVNSNYRDITDAINENF